MRGSCSTCSQERFLQASGSECEDEAALRRWMWLAGVISGYSTSNSEETKRMVELESLIQKGRKEIAVLQKRVRTKKVLYHLFPGNYKIPPNLGEKLKHLILFNSYLKVESILTHLYINHQGKKE